MAVPLNVTEVGASGCYRRHNTVDVFDQTAVDGACPGNRSASGHYQCCAMGYVCLSNGFCHGNSPVLGGSGYYMGGCTDPNFEDREACPFRCSKLAHWQLDISLLTESLIASLRLPDVTYNSTTGLWHCCGTDAEGNVLCETPSEDTFLAPPPEELLDTSTENTNSTVSTNSTISSATSSNFDTASSTPASTAPAEAVTTTSFPIGGIVGVVIGVLALVAVVAVVWYVRHRKRNRTVKIARKSGTIPGEVEQPHMIQTPGYANRHELESNYYQKGRAVVNGTPTEMQG